jgi:protein-disulfide isomerase
MSFRRRAPTIFLFWAAACRAAGDDPSPASVTSLREEVEALKQGQIDILRELQTIKELLVKRASQETARVHILDSPALGAATAPLTLVEFTDFQCPYCREYARETMPKIIERFVKTGKVRYVSRNFPVTQMHPLAESAAEAAMCAAEQGKFWQAHEFFFDNQVALSEVIQLKNADAAIVGVDEEVFAKCMDTNKYRATVRKDLAEGLDLGIRGTPTFLLGRADSKDPSVVYIARSLIGAMAFSDFEAAINELLNGK